MPLLIRQESRPLKTIATVTAVASNKLVKVSLHATLSDGTSVAYTLPFNPETLEITVPTKFGQYGGVVYQPRMYYSGRDANRMNIRFIARDRVMD